MARLLRREWIPHVILVTALLLTAATARSTYLNRAREDGLRFRNTATALQGTIFTRLENYVAMLLGGAGLFAASDEVTRDEFRSYVERLELERRYPGIQGIGFSRLIREGERDSVFAAVSAEHPAFAFWPPPPLSGDFTSVVFIEPEDVRNLGALGYDMASEATRRVAMDRARDLGVPASTRRVRLVQERAVRGPEQPGFLIYVPVYRGGLVPATVEERQRKLLGFVYCPFRAEDLFSSVLSAEARAAVGVEVFDGQPEEGRLLYASQPERTAAAFAVALPMDVAGVRWTVVVRGAESLGSSGQWTLALIVGGGIALSALLFLVTRSQVTGRAEAERRAEELRRSEERLREVDREKDAFLATISHELRTPLNAIVGWASMLGRGIVPPSTQAHAIAVIKRNAAAQTRLIEDLLDMSRAVAGHLNLHITDVDVQVTLDATIDALRPQADAAGLQLRFEPRGRLGLVEADAGRLQQIVTNLLSNAVKFTPRGGDVLLRAERAAGMLQIEVADTGIGIDPAFVPYLFDRFRQADSSPTRAHSGAGLGLAIAKHLIELHGGTIDVSSAGPSQGATFVVRMPTSQRGRSSVTEARSTGQHWRDSASRPAS